MKKSVSLLPFLLVWAIPFFAQTISTYLKIDQFGYLPESAKVAIIADPEQGFNSAESYTPGNTLQVRRVSDNSAVYSAAPVAWNSGATDEVSGDRAWWFDFSSVAVAGEYYIFDPANNTRSESFRIATDVYDAVLKTALRVFYYQRCGQAKPASFAGAKWADPSPCHTGASQDKQCRLFTNPTAVTERDLSGGWHDAGDYNKYVNFALNPVLDLASDYLETPAIFGDSNGIPESGNGIPDLLDELKIELDWLLKMQQTDGSVICVVGGGDASPASADAAVRRYGPATTSASFSAAAMFAIGSRAFRQAGNTAYAGELQAAAIGAWAWADAHPGVTFYNAGKLAAGEQETDDYGLFVSRLCAAIYLYDITGTSLYKNWVLNNYSQHHLFQWSWASMYEAPGIDALLYFSKLPDINSAVVAQIRNTFSNSLSTATDHLGSFNSQSDPYRAYLNAGNYVWGSNQVKSREGLLLLNMLTYNLNPAQHAKFREAAAGHLHYLHGVNPFGLCFLTNMADFGAGNSAREMYHIWFGDGTAWDNALSSPKGPAPGYLTGGPNRYYSLDGCCPTNCGSPQNNALCSAGTLQPPLNQPAMKSYKDWNTSWPQNSWQITEPAIYYQSAYVRLLSKFVQKTSVRVVEVQPNRLAFTLYPNPAEQYCHVRIHPPITDTGTVRVFDTMGRVWLEQRIMGDEIRLDLAGLPAGVYVIQVQTGRNMGVQCLVLK